MSFEIVIPGRPITKKNHSDIVRGKDGRPFLIPSKQYRAYQEKAGWHLKHKGAKLSGRYNLKGVYYMPTHHKVDLANLLAATCDILVHYGVIADDNSDIIATHDGSHVGYDKENPRAEITITEVSE
jgi:Holliday junction resolvase RusA-like endonuclease